MIKWVGFGKSLKQLFIIGLISCFILLGGSFVSAGYTRQVGSYGYNPYLQSFDINLTRAGNPLTSSLGYTKQIFVIQQTSSDFCAWFWNDGLPYNYCIRRNTKQGNIQSYQVCSEILDISQTSKPGNCVSNNVGESTKEIIKNFLSSLTIDDYYWFNYSTTDFGWGEFCISNHSVSSSFCFSFNSSSNNFTNTLNLTGGLRFDSFPTSVLENPPSSSSNGGGSSFNVYTGSRLRGMLGIEDDYTNLDMVHGYEGIGVFSDLCYGGFDIDDIFDPSESFEDFAGYKAGQGATIFQLYSRYSGFNSMTQFLQTILTRYQNNQINQFKTEPKALLMVGSQLNVAGVKASYVAEYCDLLLNSDYRDIYTGNSVDSLRVKNWLNNQSNRNILRNSSGQNITMQTTNVGLFGSGENIDFDPANFFSNIMDQINTKLSNPTKGGAVGILPGYIVAVFLGIIFIRLISH